VRGNRQQGIVLVLTLLLLVVLTLFVLSSTRLTTGNLRIIGNMQAKKAVEAVAQQGVEEVLSSLAPFSAPNSAITLTTPVPSGMSTPTVATPRVCFRAAPAPGFSAVAAVAFEDTYWNVNVTVNDTITNSGTVVNQGVRIRLLKGNCP
jgi:Tfp pilus assembly protein PilX